MMHGENQLKPVRHDRMNEAPHNEIRLDPRKQLGQQGEDIAARFLEQNGYRIVAANFTVPVGRNSRGAQVTGEIDLIALDGETICFVEVKTRRSDEYLAPTANVDLRKQRQIIRTAKVYRRIFNIWQREHRYDVVSVVIPEADEPRVELLKGFWTEEKFKKRSWHREVWQEFI
jgi:putative endonuclease